MRLAHERRGSGEPLVLLHATGLRWQAWRPVLDRLSAERDVIAPDLPGFGASPALEGEAAVSPDRYADVIESFLDGLGIKGAHVAGNSLGGGIALVLGARGRARTVTTLSPIGFSTPREAEFCRASIQLAAVSTRALRPVAPAVLGTALGRTLTSTQLFARPWRVPAADLLESSEAFAASRGLRAALDGFRHWRFVPDGPLPCPTTIAWAQRDRLLPPRQAQRARRAVPGARHVVLTGCGHLPMWDDPEQVASVLLEGSRPGSGT